MAEYNASLAKFIKKLQDDGIESGNIEQAKIIKDANFKATQIINEAKNQAKKIFLGIEEEHKKKEDFLNSELKMAARDFLIKLKQEIKKKIINPSIKEKVTESMSDISFLKKCLKNVILNYQAQEKEKLTLVVSENVKKTLETYFKQEINPNIKKINLTFALGDFTAGFQLKSNNNNYIWDFTDNTLTKCISSLIDSSLSDYLLGSK